jgi:hypothetical protein
MTSSDYLNDIKEIKNLMNKSSRFISLSGLSGIMAGIYALIGAWFAHREISTAYSVKTSLWDANEYTGSNNLEFNLFLIAGIVIT